MIFSIFLPNHELGVHFLRVNFAVIISPFEKRKERIFTYKYRDSV